MAAPALDPDQAVRPGEDSGPDGLLARGTAAHLAGDHNSAVQLLQRAFRALVDRRCPDDALKAACHLALVFAFAGEQALFNGWLARAQRLLAQSPKPPSVGRGYVAVLELHRALGSGDAAAIGPLAAEVLDAGTRHRDPDLMALGLVAQGRSTLYVGDVPAGLALLDEAMAVVLAGEPGPLATGMAWCAAIEACQEIGAMDRMVEWTRALRTWCEDQPGLAAFTGQCALHTGQVLTLHGAWSEAATEFAAAHGRFLEHGQAAAAGCAERERGDVLRMRGELDGAEAAYRSAAELGCDPQPGLALLWLARGHRIAAVAAVRRCLAETALPAHRIALLPAGVEILLADGNTDGNAEEVTGLLAELDSLAGATGCAPVAAAAASGHARAELARQDAHGALPYARKAVRLWNGIGCPFEAARARILIAWALRLAGDEQSCRQELEAVRQVLVRLGAAPTVAEVDELLAAGTQQAGTGPSGLTAREVEVLRLVAEGASNHQVARQLSLSEKTVARHLSNIFTKIDVGSRTEAASFAYEHGLM